MSIRLFIVPLSVAVFSAFVASPAFAQALADEMRVSARDTTASSDSACVECAGADSAVDSSALRVTVGKGDSKGLYVVKETKDTVFVLRTGDAQKFAHDSRKAAKKITEKGFGISGVILQGIHAVSVEPAMELATMLTPSRVRWEINELSYEPFFLSGGMGYIGVGNGVRLGGGGMHGNRSFASNTFGGDSVASLNLDVSFGGFLIEKAIRRRTSTFIGGGYIGSGKMKAELGIGDRSQYSHFDDDDETPSTGEYKTRFLYTEVHGGWTHSLLPILHLGAGISVPLFFSSNGFVPYTSGSGFLTVNPGVHLRIVIGNLG